MFASELQVVRHKSCETITADFKKNKTIQTSAEPKTRNYLKKLNVFLLSSSSVKKSFQKLIEKKLK